MEVAHVAGPLAFMLVLFIGYLVFFRVRAGATIPGFPRLSKRFPSRKAFGWAAGILGAFLATYFMYGVVSEMNGGEIHWLEFGKRWLFPLAAGGILLAILIWLKAPSWMGGAVAVATFLYLVYPADIQQWAAEKERTGLNLGPPDFSRKAENPGTGFSCTGVRQCRLTFNGDDTSVVAVPPGASVCFKPDVIWTQTPRVMLHLWYHGADLGLVRMTKGAPETYDRFSVMRMDPTLRFVDYWFTSGAYC